MSEKDYDWERFKKGLFVEARPYEPGEDLSGVRSDKDELIDDLEGAVIARDPQDPDDQWLMSQEDFQRNYQPYEEPPDVRVDDVDREIVDRILYDLKGRTGIGGQLEQVTTRVQREMEAELRSIVGDVLKDAVLDLVKELRVTPLYQGPMEVTLRREDEEERPDDDPTEDPPQPMSPGGTA